MVTLAKIVTVYALVVQILNVIKLLATVLVSLVIQECLVMKSVPMDFMERIVLHIVNVIQRVQLGVIILMEHAVVMTCGLVFYVI